MADQDWKSTLLSKLSELFDIVLTLTGVAIVILAAAKGISIKGWILSIGDPAPRVLLATFGILVIGLGMYLRHCGASDEANLPDPTTYGATITFPKPGAKVTKTDVMGDLGKALPHGFALWVFRVSDDGRFYPLRECVLNPKGDKWEAPNCDPGGTVDQYRWLTVNLVGPNGAALIAYIIEAAQKFKPIRDELVANTGNKNVAYLPTALRRTRDMLQCDSVKVEKV